jgi:hypothetical protein
MQNSHEGIVFTMNEPKLKSTAAQSRPSGEIHASNLPEASNFRCEW